MTGTLLGGVRYLHTNLEIEEAFLGKVNKTELSSPGKMTATGQCVQKSEGKSQSSEGKVEMMDKLCLQQLSCIVPWPCAQFSSQ